MGELPSQSAAVTAPTARALGSGYLTFGGGESATLPIHPLY